MPRRQHPSTSLDIYCPASPTLILISISCLQVISIFRKDPRSLSCRSSTFHSPGCYPSQVLLDSQLLYGPLPNLHIRTHLHLRTVRNSLLYRAPPPHGSAISSKYDFYHMCLDIFIIVVTGLAGLDSYIYSTPYLTILFRDRLFSNCMLFSFLFRIPIYYRSPCRIFKLDNLAFKRG
ncbi:uncharacterized protein [Mycetomoellerius zeteki]|uniref:uncharacterized protein n=1 Tax=Mycetomoellerius zeteki TaxID=64791 RepID=UPI00084ECBB3|nr:PREDICTED: uncharacterized protein LOC108728291 [Trachymyrmex zeteki]